MQVSPCTTPFGHWQFMPLLEPMFICWVGWNAQKYQRADDLLIVISGNGAEIRESILSKKDTIPLSHLKTLAVAIKEMASQHRRNILFCRRSGG